MKWLAILGGIAAVIVVAAVIGTRGKEETVSAGQWAQSTCSVVSTWRGQMEAIVEDIRSPQAAGAAGTQEPQSETPQGRTGFIRSGLERAVSATDTLVEGVDRAGVPDVSQGEEVDQAVNDWAESVSDQLESAQDQLDSEADTLEGSVEQLTTAVGAIGTTLASGLKTVVDVAKIDPQLVAALRDASACQELRQEVKT